MPAPVSLEAPPVPAPAAPTKPAPAAAPPAATRPTATGEAASDSAAVAELVAALSAPTGRKTVPCSFWYDAVGSALYDAITEAIGSGRTWTGSTALWGREGGWAGGGRARAGRASPTCAQAHLRAAALLSDWLSNLLISRFQLDEYYPYAAEEALLETHAADVVAQARRREEERGGERVGGGRPARPSARSPAHHPPTNPFPGCPGHGAGGAGLRLRHQDLPPAGRSSREVWRGGRAVRRHRCFGRLSL